MMNRHLAVAVALAACAQAQTTIQVTESSTQTNPIEVSSRPTDDVPNASDVTSLSTIPTTAVESLSTIPTTASTVSTIPTSAVDSLSTIPTVITASLSTIPISSVSNTINGDNTFSSTPTTAVETAGSGSCVTVTQQGEGQFTIQTDTNIQAPCTYTVFAGTSSISGSLTSDVLITTSTPGSTSGGETTIVTSGTTSTATSSDSTSSGTTSSTSAPATQSGNPANRVAMGAEGLGLAAFVGALGLL